MLIEVKYNIDDYIKWKKKVQKQEKETCPFCNGAKNVQGHDNSILPCPRCYGVGMVNKTEYINGEGNIIAIQVTYDSHRLKDFPNGPKVIYWTDRGDVEQSDIIEES